MLTLVAEGDKIARSKVKIRKLVNNNIASLRQLDLFIQLQFLVANIFKFKYVIVNIMLQLKRSIPSI
jgi:hypothetical protein